MPPAIGSSSAPTSERVVLHGGRECKLGEVVAGLAGSFADVLDAAGRPEVVTIRAGTGRVRVAEAAVVLHRPARHHTGEKTAGGNKKQIEVPGPPLPLRLVVTRVVDAAGTVLAEWWLLTNVAGEDGRCGDDRPVVRLAMGDRVVS